MTMMLWAVVMLEVRASLLYVRSSHCFSALSLPFFSFSILYMVTCVHADMPIFVVVVEYCGDVSCGDLRPRRHAHICCRWLLCPASTQTCPYLLLSLITVVMWAGVTCVHADMPKLLLVDMQFVMTAVTSLLNPSSSPSANHNSSSKSHYIGSGEHMRSGSMSMTDKSSLRVGNELQQVAAFIGGFGCQFSSVTKMIHGFDGKCLC